MQDGMSKFVMDYFIGYATDWLMPIMVFGFGIGLIARLFMYYTVRAESRFSREFEKRTQKYITEYTTESTTELGQQRGHSFYQAAQHLLEVTFSECFEFKRRYKRRNLDHITTLTDRIFLAQDGVSRLVQDTLKKIRYLKKAGAPPRFLEISKTVFDMNPVFNKVLGIFPMGLINELLNILPGLFVIGGIFGTFLGIVKGLPELGAMDLGNSEESKKIMDVFLMKIAYSMVASIVGIFLSVVMSLVNTLLSPETLYYNLLNRFTSSLESLWNETRSNDAVDGSDVVLPPPPSREPTSPFLTPHLSPKPGSGKEQKVA